MRKTAKNKRPPWWFALAVWTAIAGVAGLLAAVLGPAS
jgi:hypothetical protein